MHRTSVRLAMMEEGEQKNQKSEGSVEGGPGDEERSGSKPTVKKEVDRRHTICVLEINKSVYLSM